MRHTVFKYAFIAHRSSFIVAFSQLRPTPSAKLSERWMRQPARAAEPCIGARRVPAEPPERDDDNAERDRDHHDQKQDRNVVGAFHRQSPSAEVTINSIAPNE